MKKDRKFTFHGAVDDESVHTQNEKYKEKVGRISSLEKGKLKKPKE
jgi:hypothetical protein